MNKRKITSLNGEWLFIDQDVTAAFGKDYDDSGWYHVDVPHDWAISRPFNKDTLAEAPKVILIVGGRMVSETH